MEAIETDLSKYERIDFHARVKNNVVSIDISKGLVPAQTKKFRVYLASSLEDLKKPVTVMINGKVAGVYQPKSVVPPMTQKSPSDSGFLFNDSIDVPIPQS